MGFVNVDIWKCKSCGFEFLAEDGLLEIDPNDFGTTHFVNAYSCPNCGNIKNVYQNMGIIKPEPQNVGICRNDSSICEHCNSPMLVLDKEKNKNNEQEYMCPKCKKMHFAYDREGDSYMT